MNFNWEEAKEKYQGTKVPENLDQMVDQAIERARKEQGEDNSMSVFKTTSKKRGKRLLYSIGGIAACAGIALVVGVNTSVAFAQSVSEIPVLGKIVQVVLTDQIKEELKASKTDVKIPSVTGLTDEAFEEAINAQIQERVRKHVAEIQKLADETVQARIETGTAPEDAGTVDIIGDYQVYYKGNDRVSFKIDVYSNGGASGWNEVYLYNLDVTENRELKLSDLFTDSSYISVITDEVKRQIQQRMAADENLIYWVRDEDYETGMGFEQIQSEQTFHFNENGELVIYFEKYEIAPGYMGAQEFVIPQDLIHSIWKYTK